MRVVVGRACTSGLLCGFNMPPPLLCTTTWVWGLVGCSVAQCSDRQHNSHANDELLRRLRNEPSASFTPAGSGNNVVWSSVAPLYAVISVPNIPTAAPKKKKGFFGGSKAKAAAAVGVGDGSMGCRVCLRAGRATMALGRLNPGPAGAACLGAGWLWMLLPPSR